MQKKYLNISSIVIILISILINFNSFLMGHASNWLNISTSILYIVFWYVFILMMKNNKKSMVYSAVWSSITFASALLITIVNLKTMSLDWAIPIVMVFITPLYGAEAFFTQSKFLFTSIIILVISLTWIVMSLFFIRRVKHDS